ncbi:GNAT family N-acetyltransferase [Streptomyces sp. NPDC047097]|uniref:GNAT family N-acetyltransferase n=1 Tax=Streptomyces sp. NPDC047097 TaxID=3155260 RepID=UPI0033F24586
MTDPASTAVPATTARIRPLTARLVRDQAGDGLASLLLDAVAGGASVGFLAPLSRADAAGWWRGVAERMERGTRRVWAAYGAGGRLVGTVSLVRAPMPNQPHRGDLVKLLVHSEARGRGLGAELLATAEAAARLAGLTLLVLDTQTGGAAERLYRRAGWTPAGTVPDYALTPAGDPHPTTYYYKRL